MSALATIVGSLGELSESELRQLYLMVGVRLGIPDVPPGSKTPGTGPGKTRNARPSGAKSQQKGSSSKGNPQRKSQWANHPLYVEYARLKKVVETQAKESKLSFNAVNTAESRAYREAFNRWLEAKSSFRGHGESGQDRVPPGEKKADEEESSDEDEEQERPGPSSAQSRTEPSKPPVAAAAAAPPKKPAAAGKSSPPGKGKSPAK